MRNKSLTILLLLLNISIPCLSLNYKIEGKVINKDNKKPVEYASVLVKENGLWAIGKFNIEVQSVDRFNLNNLYLKTPRGQGARSPHKRLCMAEEISNA